MATPLPSDEGGADGSSSRDAGLDAALVDRVRDGDAEAFGELVRRYMRRAFSISYRILQHRQDAEDAVQESFIRALERIDTLERGRPFASWFYRVVVNQALNSRRSRSRRTTEAVPTDTTTPSLLPDRLAEQGELHTRVKDGLFASTPSPEEVSAWPDGSWKIRRFPWRAGSRERGPFYLEHLATELDLSAEQKAQIERVLATQQERFREITRELEPRFREAAKTTRRHIVNVLDDEQQRQFRELRRQRDDRRNE